MNNKLGKYLACTMVILSVLFGCSQAVASGQTGEGATDGSAESRIMFYPQLESACGLKSEAAKELLLSRLGQALARCGAGGGANTPFLLQASVEVGDVQSTDGLVQNVSSVSGSLVLQVVNSLNGESYGGLTIPLKAAVKGAGKDIEKSLVATVKSNDPKFVRLVRNARKSIEENFSLDCGAVIAEARKLGTAGKTAEAVAYLMGIPASAPCFEEALGYIALYSQTPADDVAPAAEEPVSEPEPAPAPVQEPAPEPVVQPDVPDVFPEVPQAPAQDVPADADDDGMQINVSDPDLDLKVLSCEYNAASHRIVLKCMIEFAQGTSGTIGVGIEQAVGADGESFEKFGIEGGSFVSFPAKVGIKKTFYIENVPSNPGSLSFLKLHFSSWRAEIRNLKVR